MWADILILFASFLCYNQTFKQSKANRTMANDRYPSKKKKFAHKCEIAVMWFDKLKIKIKHYIWQTNKLNVK